MDWTRREVGLVTSGLLAGCAGVGPSSVPNPLGGGSASAGTPSTPSEGGEASPSATRTATATPPATAAAPSEDPGASTRRVFDEVVWFATEYDAATAAFRSLAARMRDLAKSLSRRSSVDDEALATLRGLGERVETAAYDRLGPHFDTSPSIREFNRERIERVETLQERGDWDGVSTVLTALADRYATYASEAYVAQTFSRDPVRGPLARAATAPGHAGDALFVAYHVGSGEVVRIQRDLEVYRGTPAGGADDVSRYRSRFGPLAADAGDEAGAYVTVHSLLDGGSLPLSIRRFPSGDAAAGAVERLLAGGVTAEGTVRTGGREWRRVFYRPTSDVMYAEVTRAGPFVVAAAPSPTPWDARPDGWREPLELTWLER